jgi:hypothetical protein
MAIQIGILRLFSHMDGSSIQLLEMEIFAFKIFASIYEIFASIYEGTSWPETTAFIYFDGHYEILRSK